MTANETYFAALSGAISLSTEFPANWYLGQQLGVIADTINARGAFGVGRQVFYANIDGFDTHDAQRDVLPIKQREFSEAVGAFQQRNG